MLTFTSAGHERITSAQGNGQIGHGEFSRLEDFLRNARFLVESCYNRIHEHVDSYKKILYHRVGRQPQAHGKRG